MEACTPACLHKKRCADVTFRASGRHCFNLALPCLTLPYPALFCLPAVYPLAETSWDNVPGSKQSPTEAPLGEPSNMWAGYGRLIFISSGVFSSARLGAARHLNPGE